MPPIQIDTGQITDDFQKMTVLALRRFTNL